MSGLALADSIIALSIGLGLAAASGFRVFLPPMILSGAINLGLMSAGQFDLLEGWAIFAVLTVAVIIEVGATLSRGSIIYSIWLQRPLQQLLVC